MDLDGLAFRSDGGGDAATPPPAQFDLVVANILVGPLIRLAPVRPPSSSPPHLALTPAQSLRFGRRTRPEPDSPPPTHPSPPPHMGAPAPFGRNRAGISASLAPLNAEARGYRHCWPLCWRPLPALAAIRGAGPRPRAQVLSLAVRVGTGQLCLCGLRRAQLADVAAAYAPYGIAFDAAVATQVPPPLPPRRNVALTQRLQVPVTRAPARLASPPPPSPRA